MHICSGRIRKQTFSVNQSDTAVSLDQKWMQADVTTASPNASTLHAPLDRRVARAAQRNLDASRAISPPRRRMGSSDSSRDACRRPQVRSHRQSSTRRSAASASPGPNRVLLSLQPDAALSLRLCSRLVAHAQASGRTTAYTWRANDADAVMLCSNSSSAHR